MKSFENILDGTWQEFEEWIKDTVAFSCRWRIRPADIRPKEVDCKSIKRNNGDLPKENVFIERG
jgi:hypothetical protein